MGGRKRTSMDFEALIEKGGRDEFQSQTVNGSARWAATGWNLSEPYSREQLPPDRTRPAGRSNRSGE